MAYSYINYPADGSTNIFTVNLEYLKADNISVTVDGVSETFVWLASNSIQLTTSANDLTGTVVQIKRSTDILKPYTDYSDGSTLSEDDLDMQTKQLLFVSQEAIDTVEGTLRLDSLGLFDALNTRITNISDAINAGDAISKGYLEDTYNAALNAAVLSANTSEINASYSAAAALAAQTASELAQELSENVLDQFDDRWLGDKPSDPTVDNDGDPLLIGAAYYNNVDFKVRVYKGTEWEDAAPGAAGFYTKAESDLNLANGLAGLSATYYDKTECDVLFAKKDVVNTFGKAQKGASASEIWAATVVLDMAEEPVKELTVTADTALDVTNIQSNASLVVHLIMDATGGHVVTFDPKFNWGKGVDAFDTSTLLANEEVTLHIYGNRTATKAQTVAFQEA